mmetsp:Transcript_485/g.1678  ORF Transcript_485/g.1678 Transcript_485/m.1678 type:complete len:205 (-) Transcript_485:1191-1805(-)
MRCPFGGGRADRRRIRVDALRVPGAVRRVWHSDRGRGCRARRARRGGGAAGPPAVLERAATVDVAQEVVPAAHHGHADRAGPRRHGARRWHRRSGGRHFPAAAARDDLVRHSPRGSHRAARPGPVGRLRATAHPDCRRPARGHVLVAPLPVHVLQLRQPAVLPIHLAALASRGHPPPAQLHVLLPGPRGCAQAHQGRAARRPRR